MKDKDIGIEMQYEILHERTWNYNGLLWKNILAFGAAFLGIAQITSVETWGTHESIVCYLGGTILVVLGIIQWVLVDGLKRTVDCARSCRPTARRASFLPPEYGLRKSAEKC